MRTEKDFDIVITSDKKISQPLVKNVAELIFRRLPHRNEDSIIILSHINEKYIEISLKKLRYIIASLYQEFQEKNMKPGDSVLLTTLSVNNELYTILLLAGLVSYGVRVLFPMFVETKEIETWIEQTQCTHIILPEQEIQFLSGHDREKQVIHEIRKIAENKHISMYDATAFNLETSIDKKISEDVYSDNILVHQSIHQTFLTTDAVFFTTSGSSGKSKLVLYEQGGFLRNCQCWHASGLYEKEKLGGRSFLDILPHTVSIRALFNAFWTGYPVCIVNTDWIKHKPQKILPLLIRMKPEVMTLGPASYKLILELLNLVPEIKQVAFPQLRTVVSTGAPYSETIADEMKKQFGLHLHNAYGLSETQQVLTTLLCDISDDNQHDVGMGKPIAGVTLGLKKYHANLYQLYIKTPYGHKAIINGKTKNAEEFFYSGDIVKHKKNNILTYVGREKKDFIKSGYGAKVPLSYLKNYYKELYETVTHIEFHAFETYNFSLGIAALIFITDEHLPQGRVTDKKTIKKYFQTIKTINASLRQMLEPFEFEQRAITRYLLVNTKIIYTWKGTISGSTINSQFKAELYDLLHSNNKRAGVQNLTYFSSQFLKVLLRYTPLRVKKIRSFVLKRMIR